MIHADGIGSGVIFSVCVGGGLIILPSSLYHLNIDEQDEKLQVLHPFIHLGY